MRKCAFTLIELLVVIAIIAILAAILFPVFAQAKVAAKAAASMSNAKQIVLGSLMYSADADDVAMLAQKWDLQSHWDVGGATPMSVWYELVYPYIKTEGLYEDPLVGRLPSGLSRAEALSIFGHYGYNHVALSPLKDPFASAAWSPNALTSSANPADTVMLTAMMAFLVETETYGWWGPDVPWTTAGLIDTPDCGYAFVYDPLCWDGWGDSYFWGSGFFGGSASEVSGRTTGGTALRAAGQAIVGYVDGHVKKQTAGALARGTNWTPTTDVGSVAVVELEEYVWDLQ